MATLLDDKEFGVSFESFCSLAEQENIVSNWVEVLADLETPVSIYSKLKEYSDDAFLLESVEKGENIGRYSLIGFRSLKKIEISKDQKQNSYDLLAAELEKYKQNTKKEELPFFHKGFVGYFSFETVADIEEKIKSKESTLPKMYMLLIGSIAVFDHVNHKLYLISNQIVNNDCDLKELYQATAKEIAELKSIINKPHKLESIHLDFQNNDSDKDAIEFDSNTGKENFMSMVEKAKDYILEGDIFQVVLSHVISAKAKIDPLKAYRILRTVNPSPYLFLLNINSPKPFSLVGSSPEMLVKCTKDQTGDFNAQIRPIAGTYRRGKDDAEDERLSKELLNDEKEIAEHVMLVDLARNDFGRVCENKSIKVAEKMIIEKYSHVLHIVSSVIGKLAKGKTGLDLMKACFPAGTLSGAPKIRAIEIINELEKEARGPYGGCVWYIGLDGSLDSAMVIRTLVVEDNKISVQAGAGVVADSDPEKEYQETLNKAGALMKVINMAK